jgi:hypothetical protein
MRPKPGSALAAAVAAASTAHGAEVGAGLTVMESAIYELYVTTRSLASSPIRIDRGATAGSDAIHPNEYLYPIHYAAGVLFDDGTTAVARSEYCLEWGTSMDACDRLSDAAGHACATRGARPLVLLHVDNFGVCHAPHARARSWFSEYGFGPCFVFVHAAGGKGGVEGAAEGGARLLRTTLAHLAPEVPQIHLSKPAAPAAQVGKAACSHDHAQAPGAGSFGQSAADAAHTS